MELQSHLDRLDAVIAAARPMPLTNLVLVDAEALWEVMDELRAAVLHQVGELDAYLRDIAQSLDGLRGGRDAGVAPVTAAATSRVEAIVAAAETTAARLREEAEAEAVRVREEAECSLRDARARAAAESAEHLRRVQAAAARITELTEEVAAELGLMIDGVRRQNGSVRGRLDAVIAELEELGHGAASLPDAAVAGPAYDEAPAEAYEQAPAEAYDEAPAPPSPEVPADARPAAPLDAAPIARRPASPSSRAPTVEHAVPGADDLPPAG